MLLQANQERRGGQNRKLSIENQRQMREVVVQRARAEIPVLDRDLLQLAQQQWDQQQPRDTRHHPGWTPARAFAWSFKRRWSLSSRRPRAIAPSPTFDAAADAAFKQQCLLWLQRVGPHNFLNLDETAWRFANPSLLAIMPRGERCRVYGGADFRRTFTLTLIVSAAGGKLLPSVIKRCKTQRGLRAIREQYGKRVHLVAAKKGWSNQRVLCEIITSVITPYTKGEQCALVLDVFSGHTTPEVCAALQRANIIPLWVPAGSTATRQPLDVAVMGVVKDYARKLWQLNRSGPFTPHHSTIDMVTSVGYALQAWRQVSSHVIRSGFLRAFDVDKIPTGPAHPLRQYLVRGPPLGFDSASTPRIKPRSITVSIRRNLTRFSFRPPTNPPPILPRRGRKKKAIVTH